MSNLTKYQQQEEDIKVLRTMAAIALRSEKYKDFNESTILNIFMTARALGVNPMHALNGGFNIINGKINMSAHFMSALARRAGHSLKIIENTEAKCVIIGKRKDNEDSLKYEMTWEEAQRAGLTGKQTWKNNPKQMLYCACLRNVFRMLFSDIAIPYDADEMNVEDDVTSLEGSELTEAVPNHICIASEEKNDCRANKEPSEGFEDLQPIDRLRKCLEDEEISSERLEEWIDLRSSLKNMAPEKTMELCLKVLPSFKNSYLSWLESERQPLEV